LGWGGRSEGGSTGISLAVGRGQMLFGKKFSQGVSHMLYSVVTAVSFAMLLFGLGSWSLAADPPTPSQVKMYQGIP